MKIFIMLSYDVVFKPRLLHKLLLNTSDTIVGVAEVRSAKRKSKTKDDAASSLQFWGFLGIFHLLSIVVFKKFTSAFPMCSFIRSRSTIKRVARKFDAPYHLVDNIHDASFIEAIEHAKPDIIVSFQHQIFKKKLIELPKITCINCHPAKLPKYRGVKPVFWAALNNDTEIGVTVHTMEPKIDAGHIVAQRTFQPPRNSSLLDLYYMAYDVSADTILEALNVLRSNNSIDGLKKIPSDSKYYKAPKVEDVLAFKKSGKTII